MFDLFCMIGFHNWATVQGLKASGKYKIVLFYFFYRLVHGLGPSNWALKGHGEVGQGLVGADMGAKKNLFS